MWWKRMPVIETNGFETHYGVTGEARPPTDLASCLSADSAAYSCLLRSDGPFTVDGLVPLMTTSSSTRGVNMSGNLVR